MDETLTSMTELSKEMKLLQSKREDFEKEWSEYKQLANEIGLTQKFINSIKDSIFWIDKSARIHFVNDAACKNLGYSKEVLLTMTIFDVDPAFSEENLEQHWNEITKQGSFTFESFHCTKDGKNIPVEVTTYFVEYNGAQFNCAVARNITDRKKAEMALRESETRFKALHDASFGGIMIHNNGIIVECNQSLSEISGYSIDELIGMDGWNLITKKSKELALKKIQSIDERPYEAIGIRKNGEEYPVRLEGKFIPYKGKTVRTVEFRDITEQKKAEMALRESEARFKALHNASFGGIAIHDKGTILECNNGLSEMTGYSVEELIGMNGLLLIAEKFRDFVMNKILTGYEKAYEAIGLRKNGEEYPLRIEARNIPYKGKNVRSVEFRDKTEHKISEKALRESETRFKALHNASFGGITIHDKGIILECNNGLSEITGYSYNELIGMNGLNLIADKSRDFVMDKILSGYENPYESMGLRKNGEEYPLRLEARNVPYKGKMVRTVEFRDITEQKKSEQDLRDSEQKFKDLANFLPQTIFETDNKMNVTFINKEATNSFGYTEEDIKEGLNAIEVIIPEDRDRLKENFVRVFHTKSNSSNEYTGIRKDGSTFPIIISSSLIIKDNIPIGARGIIVDITQRKQAEEELQKQNKLLESQYEEYMKLNEVLRNTNYDLEIAKREAEDSNKAKSIFLANMSHELRTPLFGILGYSDMLMKFIEDEELKEMASGVNRTGKRLLDTISLILDLSKIEADNYKTNVGEYDSILILTEVFDNLKGGALAKNIEYSFLPHIEKFNINTDPEMFRIIFENIIGNAIKFTNSGSVKISTFEESIDDKKTLNIEVTDTGIGMDEDDIPHIFTEFKQLSEGTTKNFPGSGLGLSITKRFLELLNGRITVTSKKEVGTTILVKF